MKYSTLVTKLLLLCSILFVVASWYRMDVRTSAAVAPESIGQMYSETENGTAVIGVRLTMNGMRHYYAYDVWQYNAASGWKFQYANLNGTKYDTQDIEMGDGKYLVFMSPSGGSNRRCLVLGSWVKQYIRDELKTDCYMIETVRFQKGLEISRQYEYSDCSVAETVSSEYSLMLAMMQNSNVRYGGCSPEEISCQYNIYSGVRIGENRDVSVIATGATITSEGVAYRKNSTYVVKSLPTAVRPQDKYRYEFAGWYTQPEGGKEITVGSAVSKYTKLYARWNNIPVKYPVTCLDVLQSDNQDVVLGEKTWEAEYEERVAGSQAGADRRSGAYYDGREYIGCSASTVGSIGATVYRYFKNSDMTVSCIDVVNSGPDTGQQLGNTIWVAPYTSIVSGDAIGSSKELGAYYKGYRYVSCSMQRVGLEGTTVYRYFSPVSYNITFAANCSYSGIMAPIRNCAYGHGYTLTKNSFINKSKIHLHLNSEDASCDTSYQYVYQEFAGWSDTPDGGVLYSDGCVVDSLSEDGNDVKLYAVWSEKEITIAAQPKRLGYEFAGWSTNPEDTRGKKQFLIRQEETLYAIWKPAPVKYYVEYYKQKLDLSFERAAQYELTAYTGSKVQLDDVSQLYTGFFLDEGASKLDGIVKADGSLVLSAYFRRGEYTLDFDMDGGKIQGQGHSLEKQTGMFEKNITIPEAVLVKSGYEFAGWGLEKGSSQVVTRPGEDFLMPNHDQTLYAVWIPKQNTTFTLTPYFENISGKGYIRGEQVTLSGKTEDSVEEGICTYYSQNLNRCIQTLFGEGYTLVSRQELEETKILGDGSTDVEIYLSRKRYQISFQMGAENGVTTVVATQGAVYGQSIYLPESMDLVGTIANYQDEQGNVFYPGNCILMTDHKTFLLNKKEYYPGETQNPQEPEKTYAPQATASATKKPVVTANPQEDQGIRPSSHPVPSESPQTTHEPTAKPTIEPSKELEGENIQMPNPSTKPEDVAKQTLEPSIEPVTDELQTQAPSAQPIDTVTQPLQTPAPELPTAQTSSPPSDGGQVSIISTWIAPTPNPQEVATVLGKNEKSAFLKKGSRVTKKGVVYQVTHSDADRRTVRVMGVKKTLQKLVVPDSIVIQGYSYQVTALKQQALAHCKKLKKVVLGKNIQKIGNKAFYSSKKLKYIVVNSREIKSIGKGAWKKTAPGCQIRFGDDCTSLCKKRVLQAHQQ